MGLLFERFISAERGEPPDIDVDFEHERREEVLQYVYERYGRDRAGMVCEVITYRAKSALRDAGKALGLSLAQVDRLAKLVGAYEDVARWGPSSSPRPGSTRWTRSGSGSTLALARELQGFPRHLSIHVGGFVITRRPLCETVPIEPAAMPGRPSSSGTRTTSPSSTSSRWTSSASGCSPRSLGASRSSPATARAGRRRRSAPGRARHHPGRGPGRLRHALPADSIGVFQVESRAQMSLAPRLRPRNFYDLVISVAIIRPGPIQGGMVHPYLRRRDGRSRSATRTRRSSRCWRGRSGVPLFQEQAMRLAVIAAGFTPGEADELRRVMTHRRSHEKLAA